VIRRLSGTSRSKTHSVALAAWATDSGKVTLALLLLRRTMPPVSVNQTWPVVCANNVRVPVVRSRLASM
jgi:hypothetical protein